MENTYYLKISVDDCDAEMIDQLLGVKHNTNNWWQLQIEEKGETIDYIDFFLNILEGKPGMIGIGGVPERYSKTIRWWHFFFR